MQKNQELASELQDAFSQFKRSNILKYNHSNLKGAEKHIMLLIYKLKNGEPVTITEIAHKIGVTLAAVTHQINTLETQNLVERLPDSTDRRIVLVRLTGKGRKQMLKLKKEFAQKIQALVDFLGEDDAQCLVRIVKKMSNFQGFN